MKPDPDCQVIVNGDDLTKLRLWRLHRDTQPEAFEDYRTADLQLNKAVEHLQKTIAEEKGDKQPNTGKKDN